MKNKIRLGFGEIIFLVLLIIPNTLIGQSGKPDLIITNVELKYDTTKFIRKPGEPESWSDNLHFPIFLITVKNIGNRDFSYSFYIAFANDASDIRIGRYSHLNFVNTEKNLIRSNDSLIVQVEGIYRNANHFKFYIPSDGKLFNNRVLPLIDESNYNNNTYECSFDNFK
jgi:hypothetical protein